MGGGGRERQEGSCSFHLGTKDKGNPETVKQWVVVEKKSHSSPQALSRLRDQPLLPACQLPTLGPLTGPHQLPAPLLTSTSSPLLDQAQE